MCTQHAVFVYNGTIQHDFTHEEATLFVIYETQLRVIVVEWRPPLVSVYLAAMIRAIKSWTDNFEYRFGFAWFISQTIAGVRVYCEERRVQCKSIFASRVLFVLSTLYKHINHCCFLWSYQVTRKCCKLSCIHVTSKCMTHVRQQKGRYNLRKLVAVDLNIQGTERDKSIFFTQS